MTIHIYEQKELLADAIAQWICKDVQRVLQSQKQYTWALSGGSTPKSLYQLLSTDKYKNEIDWSRMQIFWGDERYVPFSDDRNNAKSAFDLMLNKVPIPQENIHVMRTDIPVAQSIAAYEALMKNFFPEPGKSFDLSLLGIGNDGHTLSLFPGSELIEQHGASVAEGYNVEQKTIRITLMPHIVNDSSAIIFMVEGKEKSEVLNEIINGQYNPKRLPAQIIKPVNGNLHWFLDQEAASKLR